MPDKNPEYIFCNPDVCAHCTYIGGDLVECRYEQGGQENSHQPVVRGFDEACKHKLTGDISQRLAKCTGDLSFGLGDFPDSFKEMLSDLVVMGRERQRIGIGN